MKLYAILAVILSIIPLALATPNIGTFNLDEDIELYQTCNLCTYCNLTTIKYPNSTTILNNIEMNRNLTYFYYTLSNAYTIEEGDYLYTYDCGNGTLNEVGTIEFTVERRGLYDNSWLDNAEWFNTDILKLDTTAGVLVFFLLIFLMIAIVVIVELIKIPALFILSGLIGFFLGFLIFSQISALIGTGFIIFSVVYGVARTFYWINKP